MHATIERAQSIGRVLQYHELKVKRQQAELIGGDNFIKDARNLTHAEILFYFNRLIALNDDQGYKPIFGPILRFSRRDAIDGPGMLRVTQAYIQEMGWDKQPWLAYLHRDTLHPHVHVVSTTIQASGERIPITLDDLRYSREVTHGLEERFGLDQSNEEEILRSQQRYLQRVEVGKVSLYPAIKIVLDTIVPNYRYTSLDELNAVLGLFNVRASRGEEGSLSHAKRGLLYYPLLPDGRNGPACFKASSFPSRPTLDRLEERFAENLSLREEHRRQLTSTIDYALAASTLSFDAFRQVLVRQQVNVVTPRATDAGAGIWYVDHRSRSVFEGAVLGAKYSAVGIRERCLPDDVYQQKQATQQETERQGQRMRHSL